MKSSIDDETLSIIGKLVNLPPERVRQLFEAEFNLKREKKSLVPVSEIMRKTGWSYSTFRRRIKESNVKIHLLPGWKNRKAIDVTEFEKKLKLSLGGE